jgi:ParB family transcriptional regulator, chromosome partitioning protein
MSESTARIDLERNVDSITIGVRHRRDLGDLVGLMESIKRVGLLQPITVSPDGVLICGRRRLEAVKQLGMRTVRVWVRTGLSDTLTSLLAERDENTLRLPLSPIEAASMYRELKQLMAEDAARRQEASRFGAADRGGADGAADSPEPFRNRGNTRHQAAELVTQQASYSRLEHVSWIEEVAVDETQPERIRELAARELATIRETGKVDASYQRVKAAIELLKLVPTSPEADRARNEEMETLANEALVRARAERNRRAAENKVKRASRNPTPHTLRYFVLTWRDLDGWWHHYDPRQVGIELRDADWEVFERIATQTAAFADAAREARLEARAAEPARAENLA